MSTSERPSPAGAGAVTLGERLPPGIMERLLSRRCPVVFRRIATELGLRWGSTWILRPKVFPLFERAVNDSPREPRAEETSQLTGEELELFRGYLRLPSPSLRQSWLAHLPGILRPTRRSVLRSSLERGTAPPLPVRPGLRSWVLHDVPRLALETASLAVNVARIPYELVLPRERMAKRLRKKALFYAELANAWEKVLDPDTGKPVGFPALADVLTAKELAFALSHYVGKRPYLELLEGIAHAARKDPALYRKRSRLLLFLLGGVVGKTAIDKLMTHYVTTAASLDENSPFGMRPNDPPEMIFVSKNDVAYLRFGNDVFKFSAAMPVELMTLEKFKSSELTSVGDRTGSHMRLQLDLSERQRRELRALTEHELHIRLVDYFPRGSPVLQVTEKVNRVLKLPTLPGVSKSAFLTKDYHRLMRLRRRRGVGRVVEAFPHGGSARELAWDAIREIRDLVPALREAKRDALGETARSTLRAALEEDDDSPRTPGDHWLATPEVRSPFLPPLTYSEDEDEESLPDQVFRESSGAAPGAPF